MSRTQLETLSETDLKISVLGPIVVRSGQSELDLGGPKQRTVLAMLVANPGVYVGTGRILASVWGEDAPDSHRHSLQTYVSNLRAIIGLDIARAGDGYRLEVSDSQIDALVFEQSLQSAVELISTDPGTASDQIRQALSRWRGRPYADLSDVEELQAEIRRLEDLRLAAVEARIEADLAAGRHQQILAEVGALAEEHPLRERLRAQHMLALYRSGRQAEALRAYQQTKDYLAEELGLEPSQELQSLELAILQQDQDLDVGPDRARTERLAFLVTRTSGSAGAWDDHPQMMAEGLATHDRVLRQVIEESGGHLLKQTGYGTVAVFGAVPAAVKAAERAQRKLTDVDLADIGQLGVRMGIDVGEAEALGGDFRGPPLNRASRLSAAAHPGQVLVSTAAQQDVAEASPAGVQIRQLGKHKLSGFSAPERVGQLIIEGLVADFPELIVDADSSLDDELYLSLPGYELRDRIGKGTFGVVHRAYQPSVGREVAVKIIRPQLAGHPQFIQRFEVEARKIAHLAHPRILPLIDFWRDPDGAYLVLQLVSGGSLGHWLTDGPVDSETAHSILSQVGEALDYAHRQGIAHGDLKPTNILLDESDNAYVSDFAIAARLLEPALLDSASPKSDFHAPEQPVTGPTTSSDIYALGMIARMLIEDPMAEAVLDRATSIDPTARYSRSTEFVTDLRQAMGLEPDEIARAPVTRNPYKGLRPFGEADASDFHGRDALVETLLDTVQARRFVSLVGPSGSGKSSAVKAGLIPALFSGGIPGSEHWLAVTFTPGTHPVAALLEALRSVAPRNMDLTELLEADGLAAITKRFHLDGSELLLVIDQFEEVFAQVDDPQRRKTFIGYLVDAVEDPTSQVRVVTTLRADFYDGPLHHLGLDRLFRDGHVMLLRPSRQELIEMIIRPALDAGLRWEDGLPERVAHDVLDQPGGLPLLQYALTEMVEKRSRDFLTTQDYERVGGVAGALSTRAEMAYEELSAHEKLVCREIFLRLVQVDEAGDDTRRRVRQSELESVGIDHADLESVLGSFIGERLLLVDRDPLTRSPTVEVAHEALLGEWPRLRGWIEDQRETLLLGRRLRAAREDWINSGRDTDYLLTGSRLVPFLDWPKTVSLSREEREYLQESRSADERRRHARQRRRRMLAAILGTAFLVALILALWAIIERDRAREQAAIALLAEQQAEEQARLAQSEAERADHNAAVARSRELAASAISVLDDDPRLAKLLALEAAVVADPTVEVMSALHEAFRADRTLDSYSWPENIPLGALWTSLHPAGDLLVASGSGPGPVGATSSYLEVVSLGSDSLVWSWNAGPGISVGSSFFSSDGETVITGAVAHPSLSEAPSSVPGIYVFDTATGEELSRIDVGACGGLVADVSERLILAVTVTGSPGLCFLGDGVELRYELLELGTGDRRVVSKSESSTRFATVTEATAALSGDGKYVAYESVDPEGARSIVVADTTDLEPVLELAPAPDRLIPFIHELSEDGSLLLHGLVTVQVRRVESNEVIAQITRDTTGGVEAAFGPDESAFYVTGQDGLLRRMDISRGIETASVPATGQGPISAGEDDVVLVTAPTDLSSSLVADSPRAEVTSFDVRECFIATGGAEVSSGLLAVYQGCPEALFTNVADIRTGELIYSLPGAAGQDFDISPDGDRFVRQEGSADGLKPVGSLTIHELRTGDPVMELEGLCTWEHVSEIPPTEQPGCREFPNQPFPLTPYVVQWSPDASMIVAANPGVFTGSGVMVVWDAHSGEIVHTRDLGPDRSIASMLFSPDGDELLVSISGRGGSGSLERIDVTSWETLDAIELDPGLEGGSQLGLLGFTPGGSLLALGGWLGGDGALHWFDPETLEVEQSQGQIHDGSARTAAMSPDGTLVATSATDGMVRVWDAHSGELVHQIPLGDTSVQAVAFVSNEHLVVGTSSGQLTTFALDPIELREIVRESLTRGFTPFECERFNFGEDCP